MQKKYQYRKRQLVSHKYIKCIEHDIHSEVCLQSHTVRALSFPGQMNIQKKGRQILKLVQW